MMSEREGFTIWLTGLPFSGKKELASFLRMRLMVLGLEAEILEGGQIRRQFEDRLGFTREQVAHNLRRISFEAALLTEAGVIAIVAAISPFAEHREEARRTLGRFLEVHCHCPLDVLEKRDTVGFYRRARGGLLQNVAGISFPYEEPEHPEVRYASDQETVAQGAQKVLAVAEREQYILPASHSILTRREEEALRRRLRGAWDK